MPLRGEPDGIYSFKLDLNVDGYGGKELVMNAVASAQVWHRRLGHLNKRFLEHEQAKRQWRRIDGSIADCDVCAVRKSHQLADLKKAKRAIINAPLELVYGDLMGPFIPTACGDCEFVSKIIDVFTKWTAGYLLCSKDQALASLQLFATPT